MTFRPKSSPKLPSKSMALIASMAMLALLPACAMSSGGPAAAAKDPAATAALIAADGTARGTARIVQMADGLHVSVRAMGLTPGDHAVHIHMTGACVAPDFVSAGGHWNPTAKKHGMNNPMGMHMGDMPNMSVGADGNGALDYVIAGGMLTGGAMPLLDADGAAVVIHAKADDLMTDPAGNAGGRIACGVLSAG